VQLPLQGLHSALKPDELQLLAAAAASTAEKIHHDSIRLSVAFSVTVMMND
jgi:hypothetical protein